MTATEVRDILAAMQLIEEHGLSIYPQRSLADAMVEGWWCTAYDGAESWPIADSPIAAVRAWAEAAGVPWPKIEAVEMFAVVDDTGTSATYRSRDAADFPHCPYTLVPMPVNAEGRGPEMDPAKVVRTDWEVWDELNRCVAVIRETEGV